MGVVVGIGHAQNEIARSATEGDVDGPVLKCLGGSAACALVGVRSRRAARAAAAGSAGTGARLAAGRATRARSVGRTTNTRSAAARGGRPSAADRRSVAAR